jgi:uncharacterized protein (TIGR03067 family)
MAAGGQAGAPGARAEPPSSTASLFDAELERLQGRWRQIRCEAEGRVDPPDALGPGAVLTLAGLTFSVARSDGTPVLGGTFALDPARTPKAIDWTDTFGPDAGRTFQAIYTIEADRLTFCAADEGTGRPPAFEPRSGDTLRILRR